MTLNGVMALILRFSPISIASQAHNVTVVEDRPIMSIKYCTLQRGLFATAEHLVVVITSPVSKTI